VLIVFFIQFESFAVLVDIASGIGSGGQEVQAHPEKLWFVENPGQFPENPGKICENMGKIHKNVRKTPENPGKQPKNSDKTGAPRCLILKNWHPTCAESY